MNNALEIKNLLFKWNNKDNFSLKIKNLSIKRNKKVHTPLKAFKKDPKRWVFIIKLLK